MLLAKGPRTWGSGVSTQVAGCACCWHIWKNFSYHAGKYVLLFCFFLPPCNLPLLSAPICKTHWRSLSLFFLLHAGLHHGWQSVPAVCCCVSFAGRGLGVGSKTSSPAAPRGVNIAGLCRIAFQSPLKSNTPKLGNTRAKVAALTFSIGPVCVCGVMLFLIVWSHAAFASWQQPSYHNHGSKYFWKFKCLFLQLYQSLLKVLCG